MAGAPGGVSALGTLLPAVRALARQRAVEAVVPGPAPGAPPPGGPEHHPAPPGGRHADGAERPGQQPAAKKGGLRRHERPGGTHDQALSYDPGKKRRGRKRCLLVDTLGFPVAVEILPAATHDWMAGLALLSGIRGAPRDGKPSAILADHSFHHPVVHGLARYGRRRLVIGAP